MKPNNYISSDHASFETAKYKAYYGCEEVDPASEEWCMVLVKKLPSGLEKELVRYTNSQLLDISGNESPEGMLLAGLSLYFSK